MNFYKLNYPTFCSHSCSGIQIEDFVLIADDDLIAVSCGEPFAAITSPDGVTLPSDIPSVIGPYIVGGHINNSRYGEWREGITLMSGEKFALRLMNKSLLHSLEAEGGSILDTLASEYRILSKLKHINIVTVHMVSMML